jgi:hypothetical protein
VAGARAARTGSTGAAFARMAAPNARVRSESAALPSETPRRAAAGYGLHPRARRGSRAVNAARVGRTSEFRAAGFTPAVPSNSSVRAGGGKRERVRAPRLACPPPGAMKPSIRVTAPGQRSDRVAVPAIASPSTVRSASRRRSPGSRRGDGGTRSAPLVENEERPVPRRDSRIVLEDCAPRSPRSASPWSAAQGRLPRPRARAGRRRCARRGRRCWTSGSVAGQWLRATTSMARRRASSPP